MLFDFIKYAIKCLRSDFFIAGGGRNVYAIKKSLRFRAGGSTYLSRTPSASNRKTWTWSGWVKRGLMADSLTIFSGGTAAGVTSCLNFAFVAGDNLSMSSDAVNFLTTTAVFRDPSAWYHVVLAVDTTNATANDRFRLYVNGLEITAFSARTNFTLNADTGVNSAAAHRMGSRPFSTPLYFDGYMSEINFIDGQALDPSYFGKTDPVTGAWVAKKYTGTYGTNGFYLDFKTGTSLTTLGDDKSGNNNDWMLNNHSLTAGLTYDWMDDTPTNNFATLNALQKTTPAASSSMPGEAGLLFYQASSSLWCTILSTFAVDSGKWYWETTTSNISTTAIAVGIWGQIPNLNTTNLYIGQTSTSFGYHTNGLKYNNAVGTAYGASYANNDLVGVALDMVAGTLTFYKNGVSQGIAYSGLMGSHSPAFGSLGGGRSSQLRPTPLRLRPAYRIQSPLH